MAKSEYVSVNYGQKLYKRDTADGTVKWTFSGHTDVVEAIAVGADGYIYTGGLDQKVRKISPSGTEQWSFATNDSVKKVEVVNGYVYAIEGGKPGTLFKIDSTGSEVWSVDAPGGEDLSALAVDRNENVYTGEEWVYGPCMKYDSTGTQVWSSTDPVSGAEQMYFGDGTLFVFNGGLTYRIDPSDGSQLDGLIPDLVTNGQFGGGHLYISNEDKLKKHTPQLHLVWEFAGHTTDTHGIAVDSDGSAYTTDLDPVTKKIDSGGTEQWSYTTSETNLHAAIEPTTNAPPSADFTYAKNGDTVDFTDQSSDPDGSISSWSWDFGDGTTSTSPSPSHTYEKGRYLVTLTVTDEDGGIGVRNEVVFIGAAEYTYTYDGGEVTKRNASDGSVVWTSSGTSGSTSDYTPPAADAEGNVYYTYDRAMLGKLDSSGTVQWEVGFDSQYGQLRKVGISPNGNPVIGAGGYESTNEYAFVIEADSADGSVLRDFNTETDQYIEVIETGPDGNLYVGADAHLYQFDDTLSKNWEVAQGIDDLDFRPDGKVYTTNGDRVQRYSTDGTEDWSSYTSTGDPSTTIAVSDKDHIYVEVNGRYDAGYTRQKDDGSGLAQQWHWDTSENPGMDTLDADAAGNVFAAYYGGSNYAYHKRAPNENQRWKKTPSGAAGAIGVQPVTFSTAITGTTALTDKKTSLSLSGQIITKITGALSITDQGPATAASGSVSNDGSAALTDQSTGLSAAGDLPLSSSLTVSTGQETASSSGQVANGGSASLLDAKTFISIRQTTPLVAPFLLDAQDNRIRKLDGLDGTKVWDRSADAIYSERSMAIDLNENGEAVIARGSLIENGRGSIIEKLNPDGSVQWSWDGKDTSLYDPNHPNIANWYVRAACHISDNTVLGLACADYNQANYEGEDEQYLVVISGGEMIRHTEILPQTSRRVSDMKVGNPGPSDGIFITNPGISKVYKYNFILEQEWVWANANNPQKLHLTNDGRLYFRAVKDNDDTYSLFRLDASTGTQEKNYEIKNMLQPSGGVVKDMATGGEDGNTLFISWKSLDQLRHARLSDTGSGVTQEWTRDATGFRMRGDTAGNLYITDGVPLRRVDETGTLVMEGPQHVGGPIALQPAPELITGTIGIQSQKEALTGTLSAIASVDGSITSKSESIGGSGILIFSGGLSLTDGREGYESAGEVRTTGIGDIADLGPEPNVYGGPIASGGGSFTDLREAMAASGGPIASGPSDLLNEAPTLALVGGPVAAASAALTDEEEVQALSGNVSVGGSAVLTGLSNALAGTGLVAVSGGSSFADKGETIALLGDIYAGGRGTLAFTDEQTILNGGGAILATGGGAFTDGGQSLSGDGAALLSGTVSATDQGHALALTGDVLAQGAGSLAEKPTILLLNGGVLSRGNSSLTLVDGLQSVSIGGGPIAGGATSLEDRPGPFASQGEVLAASTLAVADEAYAPNGAGFVQASGSLRAGNPPNTTEGTGAVLTSGALSTEGGAPIITIATFVGRKPDSISIGVDSIISIDTDVQSSL